ncbi:MAG: ABC transporter substrate-binding protein [Thermoleophilia bacterium]|nr:ABC transporter substrate-binding protein [Thermoleophilia bacterium]
MEIRHVRWAVLLGAIVVASIAAACGGSGSATTTTGTMVDPLTVSVPPSTVDASLPAEPGIFSIAGRPSLTLAMVRVAGMHGLLGEQGLSTRLTDASSFEDLKSSLESGAVDAAVVTSDDAVRLVSAGLPIRTVLLLTAGTSNQVIMGRDDLEGIASLAGQQVAVSLESEGELLLQGALVEQQVPPDAVQVVAAEGLGPSARLVRGDVAAAAMTGEQAAVALAADPTLQTLYTAGDYPGLISHVLVVRQAVADERPGQIVAFIRGWQEFYAFSRDQPDVVIEDVARLTKQDSTAVAFSLSGLSSYDLAANAVELLPGGEYFDRTIGAIVAAALVSGWIDDSIDGQALVEGSFVQAVATAR